MGDVDHLVGIEIEADHRIIGLGHGGLLLDAEAVAVLVKLRDAVALGIVHPVAEDRSLALLFRHPHRFLEHGHETGAVEDIVSQHQACAIVPDEVLPDEEGLRKTVGRRLLGITERHAVIAPVAQQAAEGRQVLRRGDDQDVPDAREHQGRDRIIHHRLVEDREQLLADALGNRIEAGAGAPRENDAFHYASRLIHSFSESSQYGIVMPKVSLTLVLSNTE